jgi:hypothetical protein
MRVITDKTFEGEEGMVRVWNQTPGFVQVTDEGHLLASHQSAWVDDNQTVQDLIESGHVAVLGGSAKKTTKKNTKVRAKATDQSPKDISEVLPVAQQQDPEEVNQVETTQETETTSENTALLDSIILDSSPLSENTDSVSVENI